MENTSSIVSSISPVHIEPQKLETFFINHLNKVYCAKTHLAERLPAIITQATFKDLKHAIEETMEDVERQIDRMNEIFSILNTERGSENCKGIIGLIDDAYTSIQQHHDDAALRDLSILFYLQNIESVEIASFQMLKIAAAKLDNEEIKQLLLESFDEAKADRALLHSITTKYMDN